MSLLKNMLKFTQIGDIEYIYCFLGNKKSRSKIRLLKKQNYSASVVITTVDVAAS